MTTMIPTDVATIPPITRAEAGRLAAAEYRRMVDQLRSLTPDDWRKPTDCPLWDVRAIAGHSVGMMTDFTGFRPLMRRMRAATAGAKKSGEEFVDVMTAMQVADHADLTTDELITRADENGRRGGAVAREATLAVRSHAHEGGGRRQARDLEDGLPPACDPHPRSVDAPG